MPPAPTGAIARAEEALGAPLPEAYASFLRSFDGADLFHETIVIAGVGPRAPRPLLELNAPGQGPPSLVFAETPAGDRFALDSRARVLRLRAADDERVVAGSGFEPWLDAVIAHEQILYGPDGEFAPDAFDADGEEIVPLVALRQAERALRADPGSAEAEHERGVALRRLRRSAQALEAFAAAAALDPENPWPLFDLGRTALALGADLPRAATAFREAARLEAGPGGARLYVWAARAAQAGGDEAGAAQARQAARERHPGIADDLQRATAQATADGDDDARAEAEALLAALVDGDGAPARPRTVVRLPLVKKVEIRVETRERPDRRPPPDRPRRPRRAGPLRSGASRPGSRSPRR